MDLMFISAQVIGLIALFFSLKAYLQNSKEKYIINSIITAIFNSIHYLLLNAYTGLFVKLIALLREFILYKKEKNKKYDKIILFIFIIILYILAGIFTFNNNIINLFPIISATSYFGSEWFGSILTIKIVGLITTVLWLVYNIMVISISGSIYNIVTIIVLIYSIKNNKKIVKKI